MTNTFDELQALLQSNGRAAALERLCETLRAKPDYHALFYAMLLRKRCELGLPPVQVTGGDEVPKEAQEPYEDAIRAAARQVGQLYLDAGDIPNAWPFFRMINDPSPVTAALETADPEEGEVVQQVIDIALHQGANPVRGFELVLKRYGLCSAITMFGQGLTLSNDARIQCIQRLVRALYRELTERLKADITHRRDEEPAETTVAGLLANRDWLFEDECYHVDTSHLAAIVQFSIHLPECPELHQAIELCEYGSHLSDRLQFQGDPPFERQYADYGVYLRTLAGQDVEAGLAHFRAKAEAANPDEEGTLPAEVLVVLLHRLGRNEDAAAAFAKHLANADARRLNCPSLQELCQKTGDYEPLINVSRQRGDLVNFAAGMLQTSSRLRAFA